MNEVENMWKEEVVDYFELLLSVLWSQKTMKDHSNEVEI
jgi:hypothetical protein